MSSRGSTRRLAACGLALAVTAVAVGAIAPQDARGGSPRAPADTVLLNGRIITVDADDSIAEAVAVAQGRIIGVGSNAAIQRLVGPATRVIDLHGRTATPGLIDAHCHFDRTDLLYQLDLTYPAVKSIDDVLVTIRERAAAAKSGEWIRGTGWDEGKLAEQRYILASDLDRAAPDNPVFLRHATGHYAAANSAALALAGITAATPDPPAGTIDRLPGGAPSGVLKETAAGLVSQLVPPYSVEQSRNGLLSIVEGFNREGMTAVKDPGIGAGDWEVYKQVAADGRLTVRVFALWRAERTLDGARRQLAEVGDFTRPRSAAGHPTLVSGGFKLFMDGSGGARTAWVYTDWNRDYTGTDTGNTGYPAIDPEEYRRIVSLFHRAGVHISTHAIGDRAIDWVVDTYAQVLRETPTRGLRHGIIHANIPTDRAIATMAALQKQYDAAYPEASSTFTWWIGDTYAGNFGRERSRRLMPFRTWLERGVRWAGGSDYSVTPFPARYGIWASIARAPLQGTHGGDVFGRAESIGVRPALRSYTIWAARQLFLEDRIGSIEPGKAADIAVWDRDLYTIPAGELRDLTCELTLFDGRIVHRAAVTPITVR